MKWTDEAIQKERVLVQAARRAGKSYTALKWALEIGVGNILFVSHSEQMSLHAFETLVQNFKDKVERIERTNKRVGLLNGTMIHFVHGSPESTRGLRMDAVVLDDMGYMSDMDVCLYFAVAAARPDFPFFATYTKDYRGGVKRIKKMENVAPVHTITVDYLDMLEEGLITAKDVRDLMKATSEKIFKEELGPFYPEERLTLKNKMFKHLLNKKG